MTFKERIAAWVIVGRLAKAAGLSRRQLRKAVAQMKPLPKWVGWLSMAGTISAALSSLGGILPPKWGAGLVALGSILSAVSHSLPGTGGSVDKP
jgi:hypothetical protein